MLFDGYFARWPDVMARQKIAGKLKLRFTKFDVVSTWEYLCIFHADNDNN